MGGCWTWLGLDDDRLCAKERSWMRMNCVVSFGDLLIRFPIGLESREGELRV